MGKQAKFEIRFFEGKGLTRRRELQTRPMKLLLWAMRTASLTDMDE